MRKYGRRQRFVRFEVGEVEYEVECTSFSPAENYHGLDRPPDPGEVDVGPIVSYDGGGRMSIEDFSKLLADDEGIVGDAMDVILDRVYASVLEQLEDDFDDSLGADLDDG